MTTPMDQERPPIANDVSDTENTSSSTSSTDHDDHELARPGSLHVDFQSTPAPPGVVNRSTELLFPTGVTKPAEKLGVSTESMKKSTEFKRSTELTMSLDELAAERPDLDHVRREFMKTADKSLFIPEEERVGLEWKNLRYTVMMEKSKVPAYQRPDAGDEADDSKGCGPFKREKKVEKTILNDVSGSVKPGQFVAIIGPSGAGKTSLLNILSRVVRPGPKSFSGDILVNGTSPTDAEFKRSTGYVAQEDVLMGSLSAQEALTFAAELKLPGDMSAAAKKEKVDTLLATLGLTAVKDNLIGYTGTAARNSGVKRGLSGGERKRVSIAMELINDPKLLFADEPTSGLDSYAAKAVIEALRNLCFMGRTIVCTIHQPSSEIFYLFDSLMILAEGSVAYYGPTSEVLEYFWSIGYEAPAFINPADYLLKVLQVPKGLSEQDDEETGLKNTTPEQVFKLIESWKNRTYQFKQIAASKADDQIVGKPLKNVEGYNAGYFKQYRLLLGRAFKNQFREPLLFKSRIILSFVLGILAGIIYLRVDHNQVGINDRTAATFFLITFSSFGGLNGPTYLFPPERGVYYRERNAGMYSSVTYFLAKATSELFINIFAPFLVMAVSFFIIGFQDTFKSFAYFCIAVCCMANTAYALGLMMSCAIKSPQTVSRIQPLVMLPFMLFSGFYLNADSVPKWLIWLEYLSFMRYGFRAAIIGVMQDNTFYCRNSEMRMLPTGQWICPITDGQQVLDGLSINHEPFVVPIVILLGMTAFYYTVGWLFLRFTKEK
eukprot:TRINITY_DN9690_c0_g1_i2.p1 TRINITY_DN9690_c0_g1~~TRINITY_DN9690_c0_g1_i2.p1  ORF type:complete len:775 (-),score=298.36 TRINITY_DN9690_c0_g1_i2:371-2695(-)